MEWKGFGVETRLVLDSFIAFLDTKGITDNNCGSEDGSNDPSDAFLAPPSLDGSGLIVSILGHCFSIVLVPLAPLEALNCCSCFTSSSSIVVSLPVLSRGTSVIEPEPVVDGVSSVGLSCPDDPFDANSDNSTETLLKWFNTF